MLSGPKRKFCDGIIAGLNATQAYRAAHPKSSAETARRAGSLLMTKHDIKAEIARQRLKAEEKAGSSVMILAEKRRFLARLVRLNVSNIDLQTDGDLLAGIDRVDGSDGESGVLKLRLPDKLKAIEIDSDLAGEGSEAEAHDALAGLLERVMK